MLIFVLTLDEAGGWTMFQNFFQSKDRIYCLKRQNMQNQTIFELYADNNQSSSNSKNILKPAKKI